MRKFKLLLLALMCSFAIYGQSIFFGDKITLYSGDYHFQIRGTAAGDVNEDGLLDMIVESSNNEHKFAVISDVWGDATQEVQSHLPDFYLNIYGSALADFDGDGDLDYVTAGPDGNSEQSNNAIYYYDSVAGRYEKSGTTNEFSNVYFYGVSVLTGEFTGDDKIDILWSATNGVYLGTNTTSTVDSLAFNVVKLSNSLNVSWVGNLTSEVGDFNGDGIKDFVMTDGYSNSQQYGGFYQLGLSNGNGTFTTSAPSISNDSLLPWSIDVADFNLDGKDDFVISKVRYNPSDRGQVMIYTRNSTNDGFDVQTIRQTDTTSIDAVFTEDVNTDGYPDLIVMYESRTFLSVHLNQGDGTFLETIDGLMDAGNEHEIFFDDINGTACNNKIIGTANDKVVVFDLFVDLAGSMDIEQCVSYTNPSGDETYLESGIYYDTISGVGGCDSVIRLDVTIRDIDSTIQPAMACDSYTWIDGNIYTESNNIATHTLTNQYGCDSVVTLNLTVSTSDTTTVSVFACETYTWEDGVTYTETTDTPTVTFQNFAGCDSIIRLDLHIGGADATTQVVEECLYYFWQHTATFYLESTNTPTATLTNQYGCDSVVTLDLTIFPYYNEVDTIEACDSYVWVDGITYTENNTTATHLLTSVDGCDSTMRLHLTILNSSVNTDVVTACDTYTWIDGNIYTESNNSATQTLVNAVGCDSVITLDLTINESYAVTDEIIACETYTWIDGVEYTESNSTAMHTLTALNGCDSVVTLNLTIGEPDAVTDVVETCGPYTWIDGVEYTANNNTASHTLTNQLGCDSVITLNLTIGAPDAVTDVVEACGPYTWIDGVEYTANNSTATHTLTNQYGCDSVITLNLTIITLDLTTSADQATITATQENADYRWLDCDDSYSFIDGETAQTFTATVNGNYAVELTIGSCIDTSECVNIIVDVVDQNQFVDLINVYPNPTSGKVFLEFSEVFENISITVKSVDGKIVHKIEGITDTSYELDIQASSGLYYIEVVAGDDKAILKVMKE